VAEKCGTGSCGTGFQPVDGECGTGLQPMDEPCGTGFQPVEPKCGTGFQPLNEKCGTGFQPVDAITLTESGLFIGSLPWSSPEQAAGRHGDTDVRTDVYSLGVVLFRLLTGRFPYDVEGSLRDVLDRIIEAAPARPRTLSRDIDADVETIILKCLRKERERRYQSAGQLAADVRRYLADQPIEARRDSFTYVASKFVRRNPVSTGLAAALVLVLLISVPAFITLWRQAVTQGDRATTSAQDADDAFRFISVMLNSDASQESGAEFVEVQNKQFSEAVARLDSMGTDRPGLQWRVRRMLSSYYGGIQNIEAEIAQSATALEMARLAFGRDSEEVANELIEHGSILTNWGDLGEAEALIREGLALRRERFGENDPGAMQACAALAFVATKRKDHVEFDRWVNAHLAIARALPTPQSRDLPFILKNWGDQLHGMGRNAEAVPLKSEALALAEADPSINAEALAHFQHSLAVTLRVEGRLTEAEAPAWKAWQTRHAIYNPDHYAVVFRGVSAGNLGVILARQGRFAEAEPLLLDGFQMCNRSLWIDRSHWAGEVAGFLVELYESWDAAEPGRGYAEEAEHWRALAPPALGSAEPAAPQPDAEGDAEPAPTHVKSAPTDESTPQGGDDDVKP